MIQFSGAGKRFGHKLLFEDLDWLITPKDRVGIVGANGTGKSTLLKVLGGMESLDYGSLTTIKGHGRLPAAGRTDVSGRASSPSAWLSSPICAKLKPSWKR